MTVTLSKMDRIQVDGYGEVPESMLALCRSPTRYSAVLPIDINDSEKVSLYSFVSDTGDMNFRLFTREFNTSTLLVSRALNIVASDPHLVDSTVDKLASWLLDPNNFCDYARYEIKFFD